MRVFWHNGALQVLPENKRETELLRELTDNLTTGKPLETQRSIPGGETPSGDGLFELLVGNEKPSPCRHSRQPDNKRKIVSINELR